MTLIKLANNADIQPGKILEVTLDEDKFILLENKGKIKAFQANCPHQGAPLAEGQIKNGHLVCPLHHWHFSCENGMNKEHDTCLKSFPITIRNKEVLIDPKVLGREKKSAEDAPIQSIKDLPSPKGTFLLGNLPEFQNQEKHLVLEKWVEECGKLFKINLLGKEFVVSADPDLNHQILKHRPDMFRRFFKISEIMEEMGIMGVFNAEGNAWKKHRKLTSEALNMRNIKGFFPTISQVTHRLFRKLKAFDVEGKEVDVQKLMMRYTVDITTVIAFGYPMNTLENEGDVIQGHLEKIFPMVNQRITAPLTYWRFLKLRKDRELDNALLEIEKTIMDFISEARNRLKQNPDLKEKPGNFLEALLVQQEKEGNFSDHEVFGNVFTLLLAGEDTTSNSISWALFYLAQNPAAVKKIRQETQSIFPSTSHPVDYEMINRLKYTEAVAMEAIRLKPVTPNLYFQALEDTQINNFLFKQGTTIMMQNKVAQTSDDNFAEAGKFIPERWLKTGCPVHGAHKPEMIKAFGSGPRFCPGKNLAMHEMIMSLSMICKNFDLELVVKPEKVKEIFAFTMYPENLWLRFKTLDPAKDNVGRTEDLNMKNF
ncbi:cytochrome P450 [Xanthovirga aplysinae]|uniref:cytochrome P450 n=1 Tax=Xanthovirga aplysinae TaxID=2529853 RepID=UPI0012BC3AC0|nr:cytochrome P450 [Xanthovirga aplysinae]MTI32572.1 cytochrome P450 [Xanthovirga aplysinae]